MTIILAGSNCNKNIFSQGNFVPKKTILTVLLKDQDND